MTDKEGGSYQRIPKGYILLSRKLIESEIWDKPPMYLKVWVYILTKARHKAEKGFERGEALISIPELQEACSHKVGYRTEKPKKHEIDNILRWLRRASEGQHGYDNEEHTSTPMITTTKTTRGMVVKVHNYNVYQDPKNYEYDSENDSGYDNATTTNTTMLRQHPDTIHKNDKELKNDKNDKNDKEYIYHSEKITNTFDLLQEHGIGSLNIKPDASMELNKYHQLVGDQYLIQFIEKAKRAKKGTASYVLGIARNETEEGKLTKADLDKNKKPSKDPTQGLKELTEEDVMGGN